MANLARTHYQNYNSDLDLTDEVVCRSIEVLATFDGYLVNSPIIAEYLHDVLGPYGKKIDIFDGYYSSAPRQGPHRLALNTPRLAYFGIHWDGKRFHELLEILAQSTDFLRLYGRDTGYTEDARKSYYGVVPFDGKSVFNVYREAGVGLCLHRSEFIQDDVPTNRIFEIAASSAVVICTRMPFIERNFGDSVLYVDQSASADTMARQIMSHMSWIEHNKDKARSMAEESNRIFNANFALETVLEGVINFHTSLRSNQMRARSARPTYKEFKGRQLQNIASSGLLFSRRDREICTYPSGITNLDPELRYPDLRVIATDFFLENPLVDACCIGLSLKDERQPAQSGRRKYKDLTFFRTTDRAQVYLPITNPSAMKGILGRDLVDYVFIRLQNPSSKITLFTYVLILLKKFRLFRKLFIELAIRRGRFRVIPEVGVVIKKECEL